MQEIAFAASIMISMWHVTHANHFMFFYFFVTFVVVISFIFNIIFSFALTLIAEIVTKWLQRQHYALNIHTKKGHLSLTKTIFGLYFSLSFCFVSSIFTLCSIYFQFKSYFSITTLCSALSLFPSHFKWWQCLCFLFFFFIWFWLLLLLMLNISLHVFGTFKFSNIFAFCCCENCLLIHISVM